VTLIVVKRPFCLERACFGRPGLPAGRERQDAHAGADPLQGAISPDEPLIMAGSLIATIPMVLL